MADADKHAELPAGQRLRFAVQRAPQRPVGCLRAMSAESAAVSDHPVVRQTGTVAFYSRKRATIRPTGVEPVAIGARMATMARPLLGCAKHCA